MSTIKNAPTRGYAYKARNCEGEEEVSVQVLHEKIEGDEFITADINEAGTKLKISLDTDYQPHIVELENDSGTLDDETYMKLCGPTSSYTAIVLINNEFYLAGEEQDSFDTYVHVGRDNGTQVKVKTLYIYTDPSAINYKQYLVDETTLVVTTGTSFKIGSTTVTETQLKKLLELIS